MHNCLQIAELVDMICSQFDCWANRSDRRALAAVARTCMTFRDPALDRLWRSTSLGQLLVYCMPSDLWTMGRESLPDGPGFTTRMLRPICDSDWQRVRLYAPRVRMLSSGDHHLWDLGPIFRSLRLAFPESLLHNLQDLRWQYYHPQYISIFLRPSMTRISLHLSTASHCSILPVLDQRCPNLADISITASSDLDLQPLSCFVARLRGAKSLYVPCLEQDALQYLSMLPTLESLTMRILAKRLVVPAAPTVPTFPALHHLEIDEATVSDTTQFLRMCRDVPLETLRVQRVRSRSGPLTADMESFFSVLAARVSHSTLTRLRINGHTGRWSYRARSIYLIQPETLALLLCFKNMTFLHLACDCGFDLDDDTVSRMARAWPQIETLRLAGILPSASRPRATLASLHSIARHCPRIVALTMAFDGSAVPSPCTASPGVVVRNDGLREMNVLHSPITTAIAMQQFLSGLFPNLYRITTSREGMDNNGYAQLAEEEEEIRYHRCWKEVDLSA
ncbi:hypothetical protein DFH06DRAFT_1018623 [Mycena polygramma]|nr:hypothetical protein DFH06DRAFT_1018623 [Mycena polygramma]